MKRLLAFVAACVVCAPVVAAEPTADDYFKFIKAVHGEWVITGKMGDKTAEGTFSAKASPTTRCIVSFGSAIFQYPAFEAIEGYDPGSKMWKWSAFNAAGEHWVTYCSADAEALKGSRPTYKYETTVAKPDGKKDVWRGKLTITFGKDEFRSVFSENTLNGEKQPDEQYVYTRKK